VRATPFVLMLVASLTAACGRAAQPEDDDPDDAPVAADIDDDVDVPVDGAEPQPVPTDEVSGPAEPEDAKVPELPSGLYPCTVLNATQGGGPISSVCQKLGPKIYIRLTTGEVEAEVETSERVSQSRWDLTATDRALDELWEVVIR